MKPEDWDARAARTLAEIARFDRILGDWQGAGEAHGLATKGVLSVRRILDGSIVEAAERTGDHEDRCYYRFEPEQGGFVVLHMLGGALFREHPVEFTAEGFVWINPPGEPTVEWVVTPDGLRCDVRWPSDDLPEVRTFWTRAP